MNLDDLIKEIKIKRYDRSLSDEYLSEHGKSNRENVGIGEYCYGIVMIPEDWVLPYLQELQELKRNWDYNMPLEKLLDFMSENKIALAKITDKITMTGATIIEDTKKR